MCFQRGSAVVAVAVKQTVKDLLILIQLHCKFPHNRFVKGVLSKLQRL